MFLTLVFANADTQITVVSQPWLQTFLAFLVTSKLYNEAEISALSTLTLW